MEIRGRVKRSKDEQSNTSHCDEQKWPSDLHGVCFPFDGDFFRSTLPSVSSGFTCDEELFDLAVGLGVDADGDVGTVGVGDAVTAAGHPASQMRVVACDVGDGAQWSEGGFEVGEGVRVEV